MNVGIPSQQVQQLKVPHWKTALTMIINPGEVIKKQMSTVPWPFSIGVSGLAFMLFFTQTGLDMMRSGQIEIGTMVIISILGILYGTAGVAIIAAIAWAITKMAGNKYTMGWTISSFALSYSATLVYSIMGLIFSLWLGWQTAVAFGVTGVLWALRPTIYIVRQMTGDRAWLSVAVATLCGALLLLGWAFLGNFGGGGM